VLHNNSFIGKEAPNQSIQPDREQPPVFSFEHPGAAADAGRSADQI